MIERGMCVVIDDGRWLFVVVAWVFGCANFDMVKRIGSSELEILQSIEIEHLLDCELRCGSCSAQQQSAKHEKLIPSMPQKMKQRQDDAAHHTPCFTTPIHVTSS